MVAIEINGVIKKYDSIPSSFELRPNVSYYNLQDSIVHYTDGFRDLVEPTITDEQKKGSLVFDAENDVFTYNVIDLTAEEIQTNLDNKIQGYKNRINNYFSQLYIRALSSSMNKSSGDINYLLGIREEYTDKYNVSKGVLTSGVTYDNTLLSIQAEMNDEFNEPYLDAVLTSFGITPTGTHLQKMFALIVFRYESGLVSFAVFSKFIRHFRTKCNKFLDDLEFTKLDSAFSIADGLPESLEVADAESLYNEFNLI